MADIISGLVIFGICCIGVYTLCNRDTRKKVITELKKDIDEMSKEVKR